MVQLYNVYVYVLVQASCLRETMDTYRMRPTARPMLLRSLLLLTFVADASTARHIPWQYHGWEVSTGTSRRLLCAVSCLLDACLPTA